MNLFFVMSAMFSHQAVEPPVGYDPQCEVLSEGLFHVSWQIDSVNQAVDITLEGRVEPGTYMAFGLSGSNIRTTMIGSDVAVAWIDEGSLVGRVEDYYLQSKQQVSYAPQSKKCSMCILDHTQSTFFFLGKFMK